MTGRAAVAFACIAFGAASPCAAQRESLSIPPLDYYLAFPFLYEGEYRDALERFQSVSRGGVRSTEGVWVDAICYPTMAGECFYQMGDLANALDRYNAALQLAVFHNNWLLRVELPELIEPSSAAENARNNVTWGRSQRGTGLARIPNTMVSLQGRPDNDQVIRQGGVAAPLEFYPLDVKEVCRCTALAILRRDEILGPLGAVDPLTANLVAALARRPTRPNHWSQSWISCQLGLAYMAAGKPQEAAAELNRALVVGGKFDHELTAIALIGLGRLSAQQGNHQAAGTFFLEATYAAAAYDQLDMVQLGFQEATVSYLASGQKGMFAPLTAAMPWARRSKALRAWLALLAAENAVVAGDAKQAAAFLSEARQAIGNRQLRGGRAGARFNYLSALVDFAGGSATAAGNSLNTAIEFQKASSRRLFQIALTDRMFVSGDISQRVADDLFSKLLQEPSAGDWAVDPLDALTVGVTPNPLPLEHWFEAVMGRKDYPRAMEIADRMKRHRFYSTLPLGGRLLALRWILAAPEAVLPKQAVIQRQDLLARYPNFARLSEQAAGIRQQLDGMGIVPAAADQRRIQEQRFEQLARVSVAQEAILSEIALRREPSDFVFPPLVGLKDIQQGMKAGQLLLVFATTDRAITVFAVSNEKHTAWQIENPAELAKTLAGLLSQLGLADRRFALDPAALADPAWKSTAAALLLQLTNQNDPAMWRSYQELILVPDGFLWYVPFEALQIAEGGQSESLLSRVRVRYAPTMGLAVSGPKGRRPWLRTAVVTGSLIAGQDRQIAVDAFNEIQSVVPKAEQIGGEPSVPSAYLAATMDQLIVLHDLESNARTVYGWSPLGLDRGKAGGALEGWLALPAAGPSVVVLPGFHTPAENGLRRPGDGSETFLTLCALMASGSDTVLLSRWPTAGRTTFNLIREFVQELPFETAAAAWQRSVLLSRENPLEPEREPRLGMTPTRLDAKAEHPIFWAGFLLADQGAEPTR